MAVDRQHNPSSVTLQEGDKYITHRTPGNPRTSYLGESAALNIINEEIIFAARRPVALLLRTGMIVGQVTATKRWLPWKATATDGSEVAAGILWAPLVTQDDRETKVLATVRGPATINGNSLLFYTDDGVNNVEAERTFNRDAAAAIAFPQLALRGLKVLSASKPDHDRMPYWGPDSHRAKPLARS